MSKEEIGKHLFLAIVQTKNNHALLEHCIHRKFLDLSVLCNYEFSVGKELLSIGLSKMLLDQIQLSEEEAFNLAYKNSCAILNWKCLMYIWHIHSMGSMVQISC